MADADWAKYKQIRGKPLPETIQFGDVPYALARVFKRDFYAATGLYRRAANNSLACASGSQGPALTRSASEGVPECVVFKHYHTDSLWGLPLRWLGRYLWRREMRLAQAVGDVPGVAQVLGRYGKSGLVREYIVGQNLREYLQQHKVKDGFFAQLKETLAQVHARGIAHNDLNKPENILVREDGSPVLIDFQIACQWGSRVPILGQLGGAATRYLQRMDYYHILKHHCRHSPATVSAEDRVRSHQRGILLNLHAWLLRRPYRVVRHLILRAFLMAKQ